MLFAFEFEALLDVGVAAERRATNSEPLHWVGGGSDAELQCPVAPRLPHDC